MSNIKIAYGAEAQAITITLASLANSATVGRESASVDNTTNLFLDALVFCRFVLQSGTPGSDKSIYVYAAGTVDAATPLWPDTVTGADASITINNPTNLRPLGVIAAPTSAGTFNGGPWSVAQAFGGTLPEKWSIVVCNFTGIALSATEGSHKHVYQGVYATVV